MSSMQRSIPRSNVNGYFFGKMNYFVNRLCEYTENIIPQKLPRSISLEIRTMRFDYLDHPGYIRIFSLE